MEELEGGARKVFWFRDIDLEASPQCVWLGLLSFLPKDNRTFYRVEQRMHSGIVG